MASYFYNKCFVLKLYSIAEQTLKGSLDDLNEVKLQLIRVCFFFFIRKPVQFIILFEVQHEIENINTNINYYFIQLIKYSIFQTVTSFQKKSQIEKNNIK